MAAHREAEALGTFPPTATRTLIPTVTLTPTRRATIILTVTPPPTPMPTSTPEPAEDDSWYTSTTMNRFIARTREEAETMASSILNHIAITAENPERLKTFYTRWFGFEELHRTADGSIYVTDGHFNLGLLQQGGVAWEERSQRGPHHVGLTIDSIAEIEGRLEESYPDVTLERRPPDDPFSQYRLRNPEQNVVIDLSEKGYGLDATAKGRVPRIVHVATLNRDMPAQFTFWQMVFGLNDANRTEAEIEEDIVRTLGEAARKWRSTDNAPFCGDGFMNLAILPLRAGQTTGCEGKGFDHFGMLCRDPHGTARAVLAAEPGTIALDRPADRQTEHRLIDPEGNHFDLSEQKGWKVAPNVWANLREESAVA